MAHEGSRSQLTDTTPRAQQRYGERLRATPPGERLARALRLSEQVREATMADVRRQHSSASEEEIAVAFIRRVYGDKLAERFAARHTLR